MVGLVHVHHEVALALVVSATAKVFYRIASTASSGSLPGDSGPLLAACRWAVRRTPAVFFDVEQ
jgi:hypothetical protein